MTMMRAAVAIMFAFFFLAMSAQAQAQARCGKQANGAACPNGLCCSRSGYCGDTCPYCGFGCQQGPCNVQFCSPAEYFARTESGSLDGDHRLTVNATVGN